MSFNTSKQAVEENKYKAIIFDWDGTLVDSTARIVDAMQMAIVENAMSALTDHAIQQIIGLGLPEALKVLWPDITTAQSLQMQKSYVANFSHHSNVDVGFFAQAHEIFEQLKQLGYVLAVATGKTRRGLDEMLDGMDVRDIFDITRCADETASKPNPKMLQDLLLTAHGVFPNGGDQLRTLNTFNAKFSDATTLNDILRERIQKQRIGPSFSKTPHQLLNLDWIEISHLLYRI